LHFPSQILAIAFGLSFGEGDVPPLKTSAYFALLTIEKLLLWKNRTPLEIGIG
jgi:hypothetical protein